MPEPRVTVPLSALVEIGVEPGTGRPYWWCGWMADDRLCQAEGHPDSREAAVAAAVQHLADVHGIAQAAGTSRIRQLEAALDDAHDDARRALERERARAERLDRDNHELRQINDRLRHAAARRT